MSMSRNTPHRHVPPGLNLIDPELVRRGLPLTEFALLRSTAPVWWNAEPEGTSRFDDGGFWAITKYRDVSAISRDANNWSANAQGVMMSLPESVTPDKLEMTKALLINHDPPTHSRLRKIVSRVFTPRAVANLEDKLWATAVSIVDSAADKGAGDFVHDVAAKLPIMAICDLIGIPKADHQQIYDWSNVIMAFDDPDISDDEVQMANAQLMGYAYSLAEHRRITPTDDIVSRLVNADVDGDWMTEAEFGWFVLQLAIAGHETTRNAIAHGLDLFLDHPDQWQLFIRKRPVTTADEIIRWAAPVYSLQRTALRDTRIGDVTIAEGQRVGLFYGSANFDEDVFNDPHQFDVTRDPNPHLSFGSGIHFCLGAHLARLETRIMFDAIADALPDISRDGDLVRQRSAVIHAIKSFPVRYR